MSEKKSRNSKWKRIKRKSDRNLDIYLEEEYFENVAKKSAYCLNKNHCNTEQSPVCFNNNEADGNITYQIRNTAFVSQNYDHQNNYAHQSNYNRTHNYTYVNATQEESVENVDLIEIHNTVCNTYKSNKYELDNASIVSIIRDCESEHSFVHDEICEWQNTQDQNTLSKHCNTNNESEQLDFKLAQHLAQWALEKNIKLNALSDLLTILRNSNHQFLPKCAKTLLRTPRNTKSFVKKLETDEEFWYRGILSGLMTVLSKELESVLSDVIEVDVFFDGFSPHNSVRRTLWPIAGTIVGKKEVFIIAIWCGETKNPSDLDTFLNDFINETLELMDGFTVRNKHYKLKIRNVIADAPARAWLKRVNQHGSKFACERCTIKGEWFGNRITYPPDKEAPLRTDETLFEQTHKEYHKGVSPLASRLNLKLLSQFPLESFHLFYLGVMKRIVSRLYCRKASKYTLSNNIILQIDEYCNFLELFFPSDFARRPRRLSDWKYFKGTEFRRLLLYDGFLIFRKLPQEVYQNFLLFACAVRILADPMLIKDYATDADKLLRLFVEHSCQIYGLVFVVHRTYNVHHLIHILADCQLHGSLEEFSAFKFVSFLGHLKDLLHTPGRTLSQIVCRTMEKARLYPSFVTTELSLEQCHDIGPTLGCQGKQYKKIRTSDKMFRLKSGDAYCLTKANEVVRIENIINCTDNIYFIGRRFREKCDLFFYPFPSSCLNIYIVNDLGSLRKWCLNDIKKKVVLLPLSEKFEKDYDQINSKSVCLPILHSEI